jgi:hypothetical protein
MAEDDDGRRWELTMRGWKWRWRLQFPSGVAVAPTTRVDRRQGGGVLLMCSLRGKRGTGRKTWAGGDRHLLTVVGGVKQWGGAEVGVAPRG